MGLSILGGEPLAPENYQKVLTLCAAVRDNEKTRETNIWLWTGYQYEDVKKRCSAVLQFLDVIVDGKFILEQK